MLRLGLLGLGGSGKSTLYRVCLDSGRDRADRAGWRVAVVAVGDRRLAALAKIYKPKRTTPTQVELRDPPPGGGKSLSAREANALRALQGILVVVRGFRGDLPHPLGRVDPLADLALLLQEAAFQDLAVAEAALERLKAKAARGIGGSGERRAALLAALPALEEGKFPHLTPGQWRAVNDFGLLLQKPWVVAFNLDEGEDGARLAAAAKERWGLSALAGSFAMEEEIATLPPDDRAGFLADLGQEEPLRDRLLRHLFGALGQIQFFTGGPVDVHAWEVPAGTTAKEAAGAIHADLERAFVRAEVIRVSDIVRLGSEQAVKDAGLWRLHGKDYVVADGDLLLIRHTG
ncbi:redox-regulated ATPase YchF [bacterium]|nr:redox-regulated ATPase YchF [bacterium]